MDDLARFQAWLDQADNRERTGRFAGMHLAAMRAVLRHMPACPRPLTVAGTKGKGSTVRLIESGLLALGRRTIACTSPHVRHLNERWRLDGAPAAGAALWATVPVVAAAEQAAGCRLSWFERTVAVAVALSAADPGADLILEVGLGGRLDATNALDARVAVVAHLSHDHRDILGPTIAHIAREKLGIARAGCPVVIATQPADAEAALPGAIAEAAAGAQVVRPPPVAGPFALAGDHQLVNAAAALASIRCWLPGCAADRALEGMRSARLAARAHVVVHGARRLLIDGAHNGPSVAAALAVAQAQLSPRFAVVIGLATDKEGDEVAAALLAAGPRHIVRCGYDSPRARGRDAWPAVLLDRPWCERIGEALAQVDGDALVVGSFYLAGEALVALGDRGTLPG